MKTQLAIYALVLVALITLGCNTKKNTTSANNPTSATISNTTWELTKLEGTIVDQSTTVGDKIHFILNSTDNRVSGFAGCNIINGTYTLEEGDRIRFSDMAITMRACPDVDVHEAAFLKVFELTDNYTIDGNKLMLNVGRRAPLAVFEAVSFN